MKKPSIPNYFVYGEPTRELDVGFIHVELVSSRQNFHKGEVAAHRHSHMAQITFWLKGQGNYFIDDSNWTFSAPTISFVPSNVVHGFSISEGSDAIVVSIANEAIQKLQLSPQIKNAPCFYNHSDLEKQQWATLGFLIKLIQNEYQDAKQNSALVMENLIAIVLTTLAREKIGATQLGVSELPAGLRLQNLIDLHFREAWSIGDYCAAMNATYHVVDKLAHERFSAPLKTLVMRRRLLEAKRLLKFTVRSAEDIAYELGFKDAAYFNRMFKLHVGKAPGIWRNS